MKPFLLLLASRQVMQKCFTILLWSLWASVSSQAQSNQASTLTFPSLLPTPSGITSKQHQISTGSARALAATIRYVKAGATGNGSSWSQASGNLQAMINASASGDQVWIAGGTYKPGTSRSSSFSLKNGVSVLGGFTGVNGTEGNTNARTAMPSSTTLSGDIGTPNDPSDNCYHVFNHFLNNLDNTAILDGVVITGGNANGYNGTTAYDVLGGGVFNWQASPSFLNCIFIQNSTSEYNNGGGAIFQQGQTQPTKLINCQFINNSSSFGKDIYSALADVDIVNCYFTGGSGFSVGSSGNTINLTNCTFRSNPGGAVINNSATSNLVNCILWDNAGAGALIRITPTSIINVRYSVLQAGMANYTAGGNNQTISRTPFINTSGPQLLPCATAIGAGDNAANSTTTDVLGKPRKARTIDIGAAEFDGTPYTVAVTALATPNPVCASSPTRLQATASNSLNLPYNYTWTAPTGASLSNPNLNSTSATVTTAGVASFSVLASDAIGCLATNSVNVTVNALPTANILIPASTTLTCSTPSISLTATGGGTYRWNNNSTNAIRTVTTSGTYSVTVTNANGCTAVDSQVISINNTPPTANILVPASATLTCTTTALNLTATGGGTYRWNNNSTNAIRNVTTGGTYSVTVTAPNGCTATDSQVINSNTTPPIANILIPASATLTCSTPSVSLTATGGGTYRWNNNSTNAIRNVTTSGTYSVTVTSPNGCTAADSQVINSNTTPPTANILTPASATLTCTTTALSLTATGGGTYRWNNNSTNAIRTVTTSGTYSVTVTAPNGCTAADTQVINSNTTPPTANILTPASATLTCSTPSLSLTATGGGTYRWNDNSTNAIRTVTTSGTYSVTVTSPNGCTATDSQVIDGSTTPPTATIAYSGSPFSTTAAPINVTRTGTAGGTYTASPAGLSLNASTGQITPASSTPANYTVTYTIAASGACSQFTTSTTLDIQAPLPPSLTAVPSSCLGSPIHFTFSATDPNFTINEVANYQLTNGTDVVTGVVPVSTGRVTIEVNLTPTVLGPQAFTMTTVAPGIPYYSASTSLTVTEPASATIAYAGSSFLTNSAPVNVTRTGTAGGTYTASPAGLNINASTGQITPASSNPGNYTVTYTVAASGACPQFTTTTTLEIQSFPTTGSTLTATPSSSCLGNPVRFTYSINNVTIAVGGIIAYQLTNGTDVISGNTNATPGNSTINIEVDLTPTVLGPQTFTMTATILGVIQLPLATTSLTVNAAPTATILIPSSATLTCNTPGLSLTATGGSTYLWDDNSTNAIRSITSSGTYSVTVTSPTGCTATASQIIDRNTTAPTANILTPASTTLTCSFTSLSLTATGGGTYRWDDNSTSAVRTVNNSGTFSVTVTSTNGCTATASVQVSQDSNALTVSINPTSATLSCATSSVMLSAIGSSGMYLWSTGATSQTINATSAGPYSITVTAANGCKATAQAQVFQDNNVPSVTISANPSLLITSGQSATLTANGATSYTWSTGEMANFIVVNAAGPYSVTGVSANSCRATATVVVSLTTAPAGTFAITAVTTNTCQQIASNRYVVSFSPQYSGLTGGPVSISAVNEMFPTTAPGPYTLQLYNDNPVVVLKAQQTGTQGEATFTYNWLADCQSPQPNTPPRINQPLTDQVARVGEGFGYTIPQNTFTDNESPHSLMLTVSGLPDGLSFSAPTQIGGVPTLAGVRSVTVTATDPDGLRAHATFLLTVVEQTATNTPPTVANPIVNQVGVQGQPFG
ncbi:putative Ig domain-containing protein, partial [Spirosoma daeguense]